MIDVKKLLYDYHKYKAAQENLQDSLRRLNRRMPNITARYSDDIAGRGGLPGSSTMTYALYNVAIDDKRAEIAEDIEMHEQIINAVDRALETLTEIQREIVEHRYFQELDHNQTMDRVKVKGGNYYRLHDIALTAIATCLNNGKLYNRLVPMIKEKKTEEIGSNLVVIR